MITGTELRDLGFTLEKSDFDSATYCFPDNLNHGGYKLKVQESKSKRVQRDQLINVIDNNGIMYAQSIHNIEGLRAYLLRFDENV